MDIYKMPVFPAAAVFPMLHEEELNQLAADIKENGLKSPIVTADIKDEAGKTETMLVDGRNRLAACKIAGVEPDITKLNGEDPTAYVLSSNILRRHMTKGQQAMAVAMMYPEPTPGKRSVIITGVSESYLSHARTVYHSAPDLMTAVLNGPIKLDAAYDEARERLRKSTGREARLAKVREKYPDLATKVVEEELSLEAVEEEVRQRDEIKAQAWETAVFTFEGVLRNLVAFESDSFVDKVSEAFEDEKFVELFQSRVKRPTADLKKCLALLEKALTKSEEIDV